MNIAELLTIPASMFPGQEIVRSQGSGLSYEAFQARTTRVAGALRQLGVQPGDRVAVLQTNTLDALAALFGAAAARAVFVPLNYRARPEELDHMLRVAGPRVLLAGDRYISTARAVVAAHTDTRVLGLEATSDGPITLAALAEHSEPLPTEEEVEDDALAVLMFTSGTTAMAKAVMLGHGDLTSFVFNTTEPADGKGRDAVLLAAPLYHIAGVTAVLSAVFAGRRIVLMEQFDALEWLHLVEAERVTHAFVVPTMLKRLLDEEAFVTTDVTSLQVLSYGAAPMPLSVIRRAIEVFPRQVQFINAFGQTETTSTVTTLSPEDHRLEGSPDVMEKKLLRLGSIGRPLPDVEIRILDEGGSPLPAGQIGELAIRTDRVMRGYYGQEEHTGSVLAGGWLRTRDLGWMDEDGYVFLAGRASDMIIRGGENIAPDEVESALALHAEVEEAAVIGIPDEEWGERIGAIVVRAPGSQVSAETLIEHCRQRLASFKKPELVLFAEALPRNALGKVLRKDLRQQFAMHAAQGGGNADTNGEAIRLRDVSI